MRRIKTATAIFVMGSAMSFSAAYAEIVQVKSKITEISVVPTLQFVKVFRLDPQTEKTEEIKVEVNENTLFGEAQSFQDLKIGDEVVIEADYNVFNHDWKAQSIKPYKQT